MTTELEQLKLRLATLDGTFCKEERAKGNGGCGLCPICCRELAAENEKLRLDLVAERDSKHVEHDEYLALVDKLDEARMSLARIHEEACRVLVWALDYKTAHTQADRSVKELCEKYTALQAETADLREMCRLAVSHGSPGSTYLKRATEAEAELAKEKNLTRYLLGETIYTLVQNELSTNEMHQEIFDRLCSTLHEPWNELSDEQIEYVSKIIPERLPRAILYMGELNERLKEQEARHRGEIKAIEYETEEYKKLCIEMVQTFESITEGLKDLEVSGGPIQVREEALERLKKMTLEAEEPHGVLAGGKK